MGNKVGGGPTINRYDVAGGGRVAERRGFGPPGYISRTDRARV